MIRSTLEQRGYSVINAANRRKAYTSLLESSFDLVVIDLANPQYGADFIRRIRATPKLCKTLLLTLAKWGTGQATLALSQGADAYEPKPIEAARLVAAIERLLQAEKAKTLAAG
jgi:DNA-binding response OmpR family regulator